MAADPDRDSQAERSSSKTSRDSLPTCSPCCRNRRRAAQFSKEFEEQIAGSLQDVKIDGDSATATIVTASGDESPVSFRKTTEGWKLHIDLPTMGPAATPPAAPA